MMKKFLIVGDFLTGSGLTGVIFNIFPEVTKNYEVTAVGYGSEKTNKIIDKCNKLHWKLIRTPMVTKNPIKHWKFWHSFFKKNNFDIIYFNYSSSWNFLSVYFAKKYTKGKVIVHSHNTYYGHTFSNKVLMKCLNKLNDYGRKMMRKYSDGKVATSKMAAEWMFGSDKKVLISKNGVDLNKFKYDGIARKNIRNKYNIATDDILVGFAGVLQDRKDPLFVLKVFNSYHQLNKKSKLVIIGNGYLKDKIKNEISKLKLVNDVILINYTDVIQQWYSAMDVLLFPSEYEGLPLVLIEAQASNLKILTSSNIPDEVFVTQNISKINNKDCNLWLKKLNSIFCNSKPESRALIDPNLIVFSKDNQIKQISNVITR